MALREYALTVGTSAVALSSAFGSDIVGKFKTLSISADEGNSDPVFIGSSSVTASGTRRYLYRIPAPVAGVPAPPLQLEVSGTEVQELYARSTASAQKIHFGGFI